MLEVATQVLVSSPAASLGDVAAAAGISRTTLHSRFPTRQALLVALAEEALDRLERAYDQARLADGPASDALRRLTDLAIPLGPQTEYLLRERSLDEVEHLTIRYAALAAPVEDAVVRGQAEGALRADLPAWWVAESLFAAVSAAWEAVADGRLAPRDAAPLVMRTLLDGVGSDGGGSNGMGLR